MIRVITTWLKIWSPFVRKNKPESLALFVLYGSLARHAFDIYVAVPELVVLVALDELITIFCII